MQRRGAVGLGLLATLGFACERPPTILIIRVASELPWGEGEAVQSVVVAVRRGGPTGALRSQRTSALGRALGRSVLPLHVGVLETSDDRETPLWLEARGCAGPNGCAADEAVVVQRAVVRFVPEATVSVTLLLASACAGIRCREDELCVPTTGLCRAATEAVTVPWTGRIYDAGGMQRDAGGFVDRPAGADVPAGEDAGMETDAAVPSGLRLVQGGIETTGRAGPPVGTLRLSETGLVLGPRTCVGSLCLTAGVMP